MRFYYFSDLSIIEAKLNTKRYKTLSEFIQDMMKMFDNCRTYNSEDSTFYLAAESLEAFFLQKIKQFREIAGGSAKC